MTIIAPPEDIAFKRIIEAIKKRSRVQNKKATVNHIEGCEDEPFVLALETKRDMQVKGWETARLQLKAWWTSWMMNVESMLQDIGKDPETLEWPVMPCFIALGSHWYMVYAVRSKPEGGKEARMASSFFLREYRAQLC